MRSDDKVDSMIIATISNAIDCTLKDNGYEYKYEFEGYSAYLRVSISQKRKVEFEISKANLPKAFDLRRKNNSNSVDYQKLSTFIVIFRKSENA